MENEEQKNYRQPWFKFYAQDWLTDLKIIDLSTIDRLMYIYLLCLASASKQRGVIKNVTEHRVIKLCLLQDEAKQASGFLQRLSNAGLITMITDDNTSSKNDNEITVIIPTFEKRQIGSMTAYERVKKWRDKKKNTANNNDKNVNDNDDNANDNNGDNDLITYRGEKKRGEESREEKRRESSAEYLKNIPNEDLMNLSLKFGVTQEAVKSKAEDLLNYCISHGKKYKDYKAFLANAVKKDQEKLRKIKDLPKYQGVKQEEVQQ